MTAPQPPLLPTTARWLNSRRRTQSQDHGSRVYGWKWAKVLAHNGPYEQFRYGCDHPSDWPERRLARRRELQVCIINCPGSGAITADVDDEQQFLNTRTGQLIGRADAISTHGDHYHILIDARSVSDADWPVQGMIDSASHIKSKGFIPAPGCEHWDGRRYEPVRGWRGPVPATPKLIAAINADLEQERARRRGERGRGGSGHSGGGGEGGGHDGEVAATVLGNILRGLPKEECYERWCKIATAHDPAWPFTGRDFERHYCSAARKAEQIRAEEQQVRGQWLGRLPGGTR